MKFIKLTSHNPNCNDRWVNIEYIQTIYEVTKDKSNERLYTIVTLLGGENDYLEVNESPEEILEEIREVEE
jgi:hypothetical protein